MTSSSKFLEVWKELAVSGTPDTSRRVAPQSLLRQYIGLDATLRRVYVVFSSIEPPMLQALDSLEIAKRMRSDGEWVFVLSLQSPGFESEFATLCESIVASIERAKSEYQAVELLKLAYEDWLEFFRRSRTMTLQKARGLYAELISVKALLDQGVNQSEVIHNWFGPDMKDQDFVFSNTKSLEVKSLVPSGQAVKIANENQLETKSEILLLLVTISQMPGPGDGQSIYSLVSEIELNLTPDVLAIFESKLARAGYAKSEKLCTDTYFHAVKTEILDAGAEGFPKLTSQDLPIGVENVSYNLQLHALNDYLVGDIDGLRARLF